jgi:hypothetical protein
MTKSSRGQVALVTILLMVFVVVMVLMFGRECSVAPKSEQVVDLVYCR